MTKNDKIRKVSKSGKLKKHKNHQNQKIRKCKKWQNVKIKNHQKSVKIHQKCQNPVLRPKTQNTGVHAVWQKCPHQMARKTHKVTFTPQSDIPPLFWPILLFDTFFTVFVFSLLMIFTFSDFAVFHVFVFLSILVIFDFMTFFTIRPYCNVIVTFFWSFSTSGRLHRVELEFHVVVLPSFVFCFLCLILLC